MKQFAALLGILVLALCAPAFADSTISGLPNGGIVIPTEEFPVYNPLYPGQNFHVEFGSAAGYNVGTSGATIPLLNTANTHSALQTFLSGDLTAADPVFTGGSISLPSGATGARPGSPVNGMIRYNSTTPGLEAYVNGAWGPVGGATSSAGSAGNIQIAGTLGTFTTYGGISCASHNWLNAFDVNGSTSGCVQPNFTDLSGSATVAQLPTGTSGPTIPLNNGNLILSGNVTHTALTKVNLNAASLPAAQTGTILQVGNADAAPTRIEADSFGAASFFSGVRKDGTNASPTTLQSGDEIASLNAWGYNGTAIIGPQAAFREYAAQNWSVGANGTYLSLVTTPNGSATLAEGIRIENDGGITVPSTVTGGDKGASTINAAGLYVNGVAVLAGGSATLGTSAAATNPQRSGQPGTGFYSAATNTAAVAAGGVEAEQWNSVASGVDYVSITPSAAGSPGTVAVAAAGSDTNVNFNLVSKGTGVVEFNGGGLGLPSGGTGATSLGPCLTNSGGVLNGTQPAPRNVLITTDAISSSDACGLINYKSSSSTAVSIASASSTGLTQGFEVEVENIGTGTVTITPTGSTIGGNSSLPVPPNTGCDFYSDGSQYQIKLDSCSAISTLQVPGSTTQVLYNSAGVLGATSLLTVGTSALQATGPFNVGAPSITDTGVGIQITGSTNGYYQEILQNTNSGSSASADYIVGGNDMTSSAHYVDLGKNGTAGATAPFVNADAAYLYTTDNEFDIGAVGATGAINLATGTSPTTRLTIGTSSITANLATTISSTLTLGGVLNWSTGLGAINQITGPTDQPLAIVAATPTTAALGNNISLTASNGGPSSFGGNELGGNIVMTAGNATSNSDAAGAAGGSFTLTSGNAASQAIGGGFSWTGGVGNCFNGCSAGGALVLTAGVGGTDNTHTAGVGGAAQVVSGAGAATSGSAVTAGASGAVTIKSGVGGAATNTAGGVGGASGAVSILTSVGGNATGSSGTRTGGNSGSISIQTGGFGTGASGNGTVGTVTLGVNNGTNIFINSSGLVGIGTSTPLATLHVNGPIKMNGYTVSTLPTGSVGMIAYVTDQTTSCPSLGGPLTGSGAITCAVFYNGVSWVGL